jgi:hypothetical protein
LRDKEKGHHDYSAHRAGNPEAVRIIGAADQVWMPAPVLGELCAGFLKGSKTAESGLRFV